MAVHRWRDTRAKNMSPEHLARLEAEALAELRRVELEGPPADGEPAEEPPAS